MKQQLTDMIETELTDLSAAELCAMYAAMAAIELEVELAITEALASLPITSDEFEV